MEMITDGFLEDLKRSCVNFFLIHHEEFPVCLGAILDYLDPRDWNYHEFISFKDDILIGFLRLSLGGF